MRKRSLPPRRPSSPPTPPKTPEKFILVDIGTARYWSKFAAGADRAAAWADAVKAMERLEERTGREAVCRWWSVKVKRHPRFPGHGFLEAVEAELPRISVRKRGKRETP